VSNLSGAFVALNIPKPISMCFKYLCPFDIVFSSGGNSDTHNLALLDPDLYSYWESGYGSGFRSKEVDQKGFSTCVGIFYDLLPT
jgi:hypothetical protein